MVDAVFVIAAVIGIAAAAISGIRFTRSDDARYQAAADSEFPALWGTETTDEVLGR